MSSAPEEEEEQAYTYVKVPIPKQTKKSKGKGAVPAAKPSPAAPFISEISSTPIPPPPKPERKKINEDLIKDLTLSPVLLKELPENILEWKPNHAVMWLEEIFTGAGDLVGYKEKFEAKGVNGVDLLKMTDVSGYGITDVAHVDRIEAYLQDLAIRQKKYVTEADYLDLKKQYDRLKVQNPPYILPKKMDHWKPVDVMFFMLHDRNKEVAHKFVKPLAMNKVDGADLLKRCRDATFELAGLQAEPKEISRFKEAVIKHFNNQTELEERQRKDRRMAIRTGIPVIPQSKVIRKLQLPSGSFGIVYLCEYEKRKVVTKELADQPESNSEVAKRIMEVQGNVAAAGVGGKFDRGELEKAEAARSDALTEDLLYEAGMLWRAAGPGILQLYGVIEGKDTRPKIVTEYLSGNTVEHEYTAARNGNADSIFHDRHEGNINKKNNNFKDPVLLQKVRIARDVAAALDRLHAKGIIHLDIAARNIFLDAGKRPKIGDFGLAAIESDMKDQYELRKRELQDHLGGGFVSPGEVEVQFQMDVEARQATGVDENAMRKHNMQMGKRPTKWMPDWVIDCGDPPNPLIDRHADVYSFGCLMYEMATLQHPHADTTVEEVKLLKKARSGNPTVPANVDPRYSRIMVSCWEVYEAQPTMAVVAENLAELHRQLIAEAYDGDPAYTEFKDYAAAVVNKITPPSAADIYNFDSFSKAEAKVKAAAAKETAGPQAERPSPQSYPNIAGGRVRLRFPPTIDINDVGKLYEFEDAGVSVEKLKSVLHCAYHFNDTLTIATYMQCICVEDSATQVNMVVECLQYIERLAKDEHGSADDPDTWHMLCSKVIGVAQTAVTFTTASHVSPLDLTRLKTLMFHILSALCALLEIKSFDMSVVTDDKTLVLVKDMAAVSIGSLRCFADSADVVDKAAVVVFHLAANPQRLHEDGAVGLLLDALRHQETEDGAVASCIKALGSFSLSCLCSPRPQPRQQSLRQAAADSPAHGEVFEGIIHCADRFLGSSNTELLELCLKSLFQACESSVMEPEHIESFLFTVSGTDIQLLFQVINSYSDNFVLQESSIGLLAHIVKCGVGVQNANETVELPPVPARQRLEIMLECDPSFELLLAAMEKFVVTDKAAVAIYDQATGKTGAPENLISVGAAPVYGPLRTGNRNTAGTAYRYHSISHSAEERIDVNLQLLLQKEIVFGVLERLLFEDAMQQLTAASLQKSVAVIVGTGCNCSRELQQKMVRSGFNEFILLAFKNYGNDAQLIENGCHALFSTCRRHALHQRMLHEAQVMNHLFTALRSHARVWQIVDGVMCAILGLLEPEDPSALTSGRRSKSDGLSVAQAITTDIKFDDQDGSSMTLVKWLALAVAEFQINGDCGQLVSNYMRLISMTLLWLPDLLGKWNTLFVDLRGSRTIRKYLQRAFREIGRGMAVGGGGPKTAQSSTSGTAEQAGAEKAAVAFNIYNSGCDLVNFVLLSLQFHQGQSNVSGSGFAVLTAVYLRAVPASVAFGKELPYATETKLRELRTKLLNSGVLEMCLSTLNGNKLGYNDPVLIRYTLWLFLLFISERRDDGKDSSAVTSLLENSDSVSSNTASKISMEKGIEWAIEVIRKYPTFYSLQCLATMFLIWMEQHGKFSNRTVNKLRDLQALLIAARERENSTYLPLDKEGFDTHMLSKTPTMFGELRNHVDRLLAALVAVHLKPEIKLDLSADDDTGAERWDGKSAPAEVTVTAFQNAEDPKTFKLFTAYVIKIKWDRSTEWTVAKRFNTFFDLQAALHGELPHIAFNSAPLVEPKKLYLRRRDDSEMEECRILLNGWFGRITQHRAVLFSHAFRSFIDVAEHVPTARNATLLSPQCIPQQQSFPVTCVHYDPLSELVFITSGQPLVSAVARLVMPNKVRGAVTVYPAGAQADQQGIPHIAQQLFSTGAVCVTYSPELHCLYVGLADGSILFYHFIQSKPSTLTYVTEISCHSFPISAMICHHARHRHIAASLGGTLSVFDTGKGEIVSQVILGRGTAFTSVAYYAAMNWCFCGTSAGALIVYDVTGNPAKQLCELRPSSEVAAAAVMCIFLQEDLHQLYLAVGNEVVIYNLPYTAGALPQAKVWKKLSLSVPLNITSMNVLMNGQYIAVTCQSVRSVTVFDLTSKDAPPSSNNNKKAGAKAQHEYDSLSTASEKLAPWTEVLTQSNAEIRIWLQGHGVNAVGAVNRAALLRMLKNCAKISDEQLAEKLRTVNPNGTILLSALVLGGGTPPPAITSTFYVQHKQQIVVGGSNGAVVVLSLTDFLPLPNADEIQQLQDARHSLPHSGAGNASAIKNTGGAVTRGRRLQVEG